jgi:hypothetical protein
MNFPQFDTENPKLWLTRCEDYFELYDLDPVVRVKFASMNFSPTAGRWLQSVDKKLRSCSWRSFLTCCWIDRFGRDQHELLIRQLFHIKQVGSVIDYIDKFAGLMDQLAAYESAPDPLHYTMKFIDGLRDDLRASVLVQRPSDLDIAYVLAQLQEEVSLPPKKREFKRSEFSSSYKFEPPLAVTTKDKAPSPVFDDHHCDAPGF